MPPKKPERIARAGKVLKGIPGDLQATPLPVRIEWKPRELLLAIAITMVVSCCRFLVSDLRPSK